MRVCYCACVCVCYCACVYVCVSLRVHLSVCFVRRETASKPDEEPKLWFRLLRRRISVKGPKPAAVSWDAEAICTVGQTRARPTDCSLRVSAGCLLESQPLRPSSSSLRPSVSSSGRQFRQTGNDRAPPPPPPLAAADTLDELSLSYTQLSPFSSLSVNVN